MQTVYSTVIDALTGKAVARSKVVLNIGPTDRMVLLTDDQGAFRVLELPDGPTSIRAQRTAYLGDPMDPPTPESHAQLLISGSAAAVAPVTLKLTPQAVIEGRATDSNGVGMALVRRGPGLSGSFFRGRRISSWRHSH